MNQVLLKVILALRAHDTHTWTFETVISHSDNIHQMLLPYIRDYAEVRFVTRYLHFSSSSLTEKTIERHAAACGWRREGKYWMPIEAPLRLPAPLNVETADITFTLKKIQFGSMVVEVSVGAQRLEIVFDDVEDNPVILVRFIEILSAGGRPHAAIADSALCNFIIDEGPTPDTCRLLIKTDHPKRKARMDTFTSRVALIQNLCRLAHDIGRHTHFPHHFLYNCCLPNDAYELIASAHAKHWADGIQRGLYSEDDNDVERELLSARIVLDLRLPDKWAEETIQYKAMLRSLIIPRDWQVRYGLTAMVKGSDIDQIIK